MSTPIIFRDVDFHQYTIDPDCTIYKNNEIVPIEDIIYHSTNGYDYVLLETLSGGLKLYRLEFIMVSSFNPGIQNKWEHFKVNHLDGDIKNCQIDNLTFEEDVEEWRIIEYPEIVKRNMYAVSSWGKVKNNVVGTLMKFGIDKDGYPKIKLSGTIERGKSVYTHPHRLVACNFIMNPDPMKFTTVNHIDGDKFNNHVSNLEWHSWLLNNRHAMRCGINSHKMPSKISPDEINMIVDMLLDPVYKGSPREINRAIDHSRHPLLNNKTITAIKCKDKTYVDRCTKYDLESLEFTKCRNPLTSTEIDMIAMMLDDDRYKNSPLKVYNAIDHTTYPNITLKKVAHVRCGDYKRNDTMYYTHQS